MSSRIGVRAGSIREALAVVMSRYPRHEVGVCTATGGPTLRLHESLGERRREGGPGKHVRVARQLIAPARTEQRYAEENEMYALAEYEISRQHHEEMRREVAANRLERKLRAKRGGPSRRMRAPKWELSRYAGLLAGHLRSTHREGQKIRQMP